MPKYLSSDHDPLYRFGQWQANLRILEVTEIKTVPYVPLSHPFVERLIGTLRRECLDRTLFWTTADLESKLLDFKTYFNHHRTHSARAGRPPDEQPRPVANLPVLSMGISLPRPVSNTDSGLIPKKPTIPASRHGWRHVPRIATPKRRIPLGRVPMKMDELAVRSACAWNSKIAKCRRPQKLVIRHGQLPHSKLESNHSAAVQLDGIYVLRAHS